MVESPIGLAAKRPLKGRAQADVGDTVVALTERDRLKPRTDPIEKG
jgi:hypothetical protein